MGANRLPFKLKPWQWGSRAVLGSYIIKAVAPSKRFEQNSSFTALMLRLSQCQAHVISHSAELGLLIRVLSNLINFKASRNLCLKQNTNRRSHENSNRCRNRCDSIATGSLVRSAALLSASRPNLSLGTQGISRKSQPRQLPGTW